MKETGMIKVVIEHHPHGCKSHATSVATMYIVSFGITAENDYKYGWVIKEADDSTSTGMLYGVMDYINDISLVRKVLNKSRGDDITIRDNDGERLEELLEEINRGEYDI